MKGKIRGTWLSIVIVLTTSNAYAEGWMIDAATAFDKFIKAAHWKPFLVATILGGMFAAMSKMKPVNHKVIAQARAFVFYFSCAFCAILLIDEYWFVFAFIFSCMFDIFDWTRNFIGDLIS